MLKVIAIGDVHADFGRMWSALKAAYAVDAAGNPTPPLLDGRYQVVLIGDLVHPKNVEAYENLTGRAPFDWRDPEHLRSAARSQVRELYRVKEYVENALGAVTVLLGNHDAAALEHTHVLGTAKGLVHVEFDGSKGGTPLPDDLAEWMRSWPREVRIHDVQFAHAGPTPGMLYFDDFFYGDPDSKNWWRTKPHLVVDAGHRFGVYGHTVMPEGILVDREHRFAMIDALERRQYLELLFRDDDEFDYRVVDF